MNKLNQFKQALSEFNQKYTDYFNTKMYDIDQGGCGEFAYFLSEHIKSIANHFDLKSEVKMSYIFCIDDPCISEIRYARKQNKKCFDELLALVHNPTNNELEQVRRNELFESTEFAHVLTKVRIGKSIYILDSDSLYKSIQVLNKFSYYRSVFESDDYDLLKSVLDCNSWSEGYQFYNDRDEANEKINKPLKVMANQIIKRYPLN